MTTMRVTFIGFDGAKYRAEVEIPAGVTLTHVQWEADNQTFELSPLYHHGKGFHTICSRVSDDIDKVEV